MLHLIFTPSPRGRRSWSDEETEAQRGEGSCPRSQSERTGLADSESLLCYWSLPSRRSIIPHGDEATYFTGRVRCSKQALLYQQVPIPSRLRAPGMNPLNSSCRIPIPGGCGAPTRCRSRSCKCGASPQTPSTCGKPVPSTLPRM